MGKMRGMTDDEEYPRNLWPESAADLLRLRCPAAAWMIWAAPELRAGIWTAFGHAKHHWAAAFGASRQEDAPPLPRRQAAGQGADSGSGFRQQIRVADCAERGMGKMRGMQDGDEYQRNQWPNPRRGLSLRWMTTG
jgi:hypothetical protein